MDFHTWRSLAVDEGLTDAEAVEVMATSAGCVTRTKA
jgi:hypothetical protein